MLTEQNYDITNWWNEQTFAGKEYFKLDELGTLLLKGHLFLEERKVGYLTLENADVALRNLQEKFAGFEARMRETEVEWIATEDKQKLGDKVNAFRDQLQKLDAVGDFGKYAEILNSWDAELRDIAQEHHKARMQLVELAEQLADSTEWKETTNTYKELLDKWKALTHGDRHKSDRLLARIEAARNRFLDRKREYHEEEEKDMINNLDLKIEIVDQVERLASSEEWKATTEAMHKLMDQWKAIGKTPHKKNEELWQRLQAARNAFFDRKKAFTEQVQHEHETNYRLKLNLVERAEALKESKEWTKTSNAFAAIMEEWRKVGKVQADKSDEVWKRLNEAADYFFTNKKKHSEAIKEEQEYNYKMKQELLERAEALKYSNHFHDATLEFGELMDAWRKLGQAPKEVHNQIWDQFNEARKFFFARKDADREKRKQMQEVRHVARIEEAKARIVHRRAELEDEEQKLIDFAQALENVTPGKKAAQLKAHLEKLIEETRVKVQHLRAKVAQVDGASKTAAESAAEPINTETEKA